MSGVNRHILVGHLGRDPESRPLTGGGQVVTFSLAVSETWRDKNSGERKQSTSWHNVVVYNDAIAKIAMQYLKKGSQAYIEGEVLTREFTQDGVKKSRTETVVKNFKGALVLLDRAERAPPPDENSYSSSSRPSDLDDEVPF
jgi:single-strand DNA-binding protein